MQFSTDIALSEIWLTFGTPETYAITNFGVSDPASPYEMVYWNIYPKYQIGITGNSGCPYFPTLFNEPVTVFIGDVQAMSIPVEEYRFRGGTFPGSLIFLNHAVCP
jgi:hypothetical protein